MSAEIPEDLVYDITTALWRDSTRKLLDNGHPKGAAIRLETARNGLGLPLHPGAARFYDEAGVTAPGSAEPEGEVPEDEVPEGEVPRSAEPDPKKTQ